MYVYLNEINNKADLVQSRNLLYCNILSIFQEKVTTVIFSVLYKKYGWLTELKSRFHVLWMLVSRLTQPNLKQIQQEIQAKLLKKILSDPTNYIFFLASTFYLFKWWSSPIICDVPQRSFSFPRYTTTTFLPMCALEPKFNKARISGSRCRAGLSSWLNWGNVSNQMTFHFLLWCKVFTTWRGCLTVSPKWLLAM